MSIPKSLELPEGVDVVTLTTERGQFAAQVARAPQPRGRVLLIPGWTGSKEDFTPVLPLLAGAGFDVITYDQRGQYETPAAADRDYSLAAYARDALSLIETQGATHVLGHSFGGLVAQQAAVFNPELLLSLSLLCTGPGALGDSPTRPLKRLAAAIGKVPLLQIHELREQGIKRPAQITRFLAKRFTSNDPASLKAMTQLLLDAPDIIDEVAATDLPFWVGRGAEDDAWPHDVQAQMAKRLGTEIHIIAGAAHSPGVEDPGGLVNAWLPFLNQHSLNAHNPKERS